MRYLTVLVGAIPASARRRGAVPWTRFFATGIVMIGGFESWGDTRSCGMERVELPRLYWILEVDRAL